VSGWDFVLGKFLACWLLLAVALLLTLPLPITVALIADLDWGPVWAGYLAALLLGGAYLAIGLFVGTRPRLWGGSGQRCIGGSEAAAAAVGGP
jgi:hypothetical protein